MFDDAGTRPEHLARLGRGLAALLGASEDASAPTPDGKGLQRVPIEFLTPRNPRKHFHDCEFDQLAESIRAPGVLQPVLVRAIASAEDRYEIIAGERRARGPESIAVRHPDSPARHRREGSTSPSSKTCSKKRPATAQLGSDYGYSHAKIAQVVGKSRSHVGSSHCPNTLATCSPAYLLIVAKGLTVREVERLSHSPEGRPRCRATEAPMDPDTLALCERPRLALGVAVTIRSNSESGEVRIPFRNLEQLEDFCRRLDRATPWGPGRVSRR
jgi:ParB family chromosome partitioning protein